MQRDLRRYVGATEARASFREALCLVILALLEEGAGEGCGNARQHASLADLFEDGVAASQLLLGRGRIAAEQLDVVREQRVATNPHP